MTKKLKPEKKVETEKKTEQVDLPEVEVIDEVLQQLLANFDPDSFPLGSGTYRVVKDYRDGFDYEAIIKRHNDILEKYDYIVGDWGYDQLRLKGFFKDDFKSSPIDARISTLEDYLYEYCNFGCSYFVIEQLGEFKRKGRTTSSNANKKNKVKTQAHTEEKQYAQNKGSKKPRYKGKTNHTNKNQSHTNPKKETQKKVSEPNQNETDQNRHFKIRKKEN